MYYRGILKNINIWSSALVGLFLLLAMGCDSLLPEKLQEKTYDSPELDLQACYLLSAPDSLYDSLATEVSARTLLSCLAGADTAWSHSTDNEIIFATFTRLADSLKVLPGGKLLLVRYPASQDTVYATLNVASGQDLTLFTSLKYYYDDETVTTNINEYISIEILRQDTTLVKSSNDLQGETLSGCSAEIVIAQYVRVVPVIRARYKVNVTEGAYIVRFILSNPVTIASFPEGSNSRDYYFKLVIF